MVLFNKNVSAYSFKNILTPRHFTHLLQKCRTGERYMTVPRLPHCLNFATSPPSANLNPTLENNNHRTIRLDHNVIEQPAP